MNPVFSVLHATYGRSEKATAAMAMWFDRASSQESIEYIMAINDDDPSAMKVIENVRTSGRLVRFVSGPFIGSAGAWDAAARVSTGSILIQAQDDVEPPQGWDRLLSLKLFDHQCGDGVSQFIAVSDGYRKDRLCCTAIMNRARYEQCGEFLHAGYISMFSDDDVTYRAYRDQRDGKCTVIEARDLVFLHRHHYHDPSVPMDPTYQRENSSEAYRIGGTLFAQRNPRAASDGLRDWN